MAILAVLGVIPLAAKPTLTVITAGKQHRIPVQLVGQSTYMSMAALGKALGRFRAPDELITPSYSMRWSAPGFFAAVWKQHSMQILQSARPAIVHRSQILLPLDECMQKLAAIGALQWDPTRMRAIVPAFQTQQHEPAIPYTPRYNVPPSFRRPSLERLRKQYPREPMSNVNRGGIVRESGMLASLEVIPIESIRVGITRVRPLFSRDTTRIAITFDTAITSDRISLSKQGSTVTLRLERVHATPATFAPLSAVRLRHHRLESIGDGVQLVLVLYSAQRSVRTYFESARTVVLEIAPVPKQIDERRWALDCIVLDAGHGGADVGTIGVRGTLEQHVTLAVTRSVATQLRSLLPGVRVVLTRSDDRFVELHRRGAIANRAGGKLFVSLHCNAAPTKPHPARGVEVYVLSPARTDQAAAVAARENASIALERDSTRYRETPIDQQILASVAQQGFLALSHRLASHVDSMLQRRAGLPSRGVQTAGFLVLVGAAMPSVLVELGFLSNPEDERILASSAGQRRIARAIAEAIAAYVREYNGMISRNGQHR
jgi:N-acetylmuramoyl-L-alanine amidase